MTNDLSGKDNNCCIQARDDSNNTFRQIDAQGNMHYGQNRCKIPISRPCTLAPLPCMVMLREIDLKFTGF